MCWKHCPQKFYRERGESMKMSRAGKEFRKRTKEALKEYEAGKFKKLPVDKLLEELDKW